MSHIAESIPEEGDSGDETLVVFKDQGRGPLMVDDDIVIKAPAQRKLQVSEVPHIEQSPICKLEPSDELTILLGKENSPLSCDGQEATDEEETKVLDDVTLPEDECEETAVGEVDDASVEIAFKSRGLEVSHDAAVTFGKRPTRAAPFSVTAEVEREEAACRVSAAVAAVAKRRAFQRQRAAAVSMQTLWSGRRAIMQRRLYRRQRDAIALLQAHVRLFLRRRNNAAVVLQSAYRRKAQRDSFLKTRRAVVVIQTAFRSHLVRKRLREEDQAARVIQEWFSRRMKLRHSQATRIQATWRMFLQRRAFLKCRDSTVRIQAAWRMHIVRREYVERACAAVVLQTAWRGYVQRGERQRNRAAILIQAFWRGHVQQLAYHRLRAAAIVLQACERGRTARCIARTRREAIATMQLARRRVVARRVYMRQMAAATTISAWYRGAIVRRRYLGLKAVVTRKQRAFLLRLVLVFAATAIQSAWRGYRVRTNLVAQRSAASCIEGAWLRQRRRRKFLSERGAAAVTLQRRFRLHVAARNERAAHVIQAAWRLSRERRDTERQAHAAVRLQRAWRIHLATRRRLERESAARCIQRAFRSRRRALRASYLERQGFSPGAPSPRTNAIERIQQAFSGTNMKMSPAAAANPAVAPRPSLLPVLKGRNRSVSTFGQASRMSPALVARPPIASPSVRRLMKARERNGVAQDIFTLSPRKSSASPAPLFASPVRAPPRGRSPMRVCVSPQQSPISSPSSRAPLHPAFSPSANRLRSKLTRNISVPELPGFGGLPRASLQYEIDEDMQEPATPEQRAAQADAEFLDQFRPEDGYASSPETPVRVARFARVKWVDEIHEGVALAIDIETLSPKTPRRRDGGPPAPRSCLRRRKWRHAVSAARVDAALASAEDKENINAAKRNMQSNAPIERRKPARRRPQRVLGFASGGAKRVKRKG